MGKTLSKIVVLARSLILGHIISDDATYDTDGQEPSSQVIAIGTKLQTTMRFWPDPPSS